MCGHTLLAKNNHKYLSTFFYVFEMWKVEIDICLFDSNLVLSRLIVLTNHLLQKIIKGNLSFYSGNLIYFNLLFCSCSNSTSIF
jgi:hypothetical protein